MINEKNEDQGMSEIVALMNKIDNIGPEYVNTVSAEMFQYQPFFVTVLVGYRTDVSLDELEEMMKIYFLIWEYFGKNPGVRVTQITEKNFEAVQLRHIKMLKDAQGGLPDARRELYANDWDYVKSKSLAAMIVLRIRERPVLAKMDKEKRGIILVGIKSFIECFEALI